MHGRQLSPKDFNSTGDLALVCARIEKLLELGQSWQTGFARDGQVKMLARSVNKWNAECRKRLARLKS